MKTAPNCTRERRITKMDEGTFRSTPTTHPMERRKKLIDADKHNSSVLNQDENRVLLSTAKKSLASRPPLRTLTNSKRQFKLKGAAERKIRAVKRTWGVFKSRVNLNPKWKPTEQWAATLATPNTPTTRQHLINSPLTPMTLRNSRCTAVANPRWMAIRDFNNKTPGTPSTPGTPYSRVLRSSAKRAGQQTTPRRPGSPRTPRNRASSSCSPFSGLDSPGKLNTSSMSIDTSAVFREVIDRMEALNSGLETFEKMSSSLTGSIKANDSNEEAPKDTKPAKPLRRQNSSFLRRSSRLQSSQATAL